MIPTATVQFEEDSLEESLGDFYLLDDVFKLRAADKIQIPLVAFPRSERAVTDFEYHTGQDMDRYVDLAAKYYTEANIKADGMKRAALLGRTDLDWIVSAFGLQRAGYAVLALSPRLSAQAMINLMEKTHCETLIYGDSSHVTKTAKMIKEEDSIQVLPMMSRKDYDKPGTLQTRFVREIDRDVERDRIALIQHSAGSTGLPKPIFSKHIRFTAPYPMGPGNREVMTLPLFHSFGFAVLPQRWYHRRTIYFLNPALPLTCENLTAVINEARPSVLNTVPYGLKLLSEQQSGIEALRSCQEVVFVGSRCPDELGDRLVHQGVQLSSAFGLTECGYVGSSLDPRLGTDAWSYIRPPPPLRNHIWPKPLGDNNFEFVFLRDYPGLVESNSDDPPESYHSRDIFRPHPSIPNAWKYLGRLDDRVTLVNGEKVLPLPIEGHIRGEALVKEAVVFGVARSIPGLLAFRAESARDMSDVEFISAIWPAVEAANQHAEGFSQIGKDMIVPLPAGIAIPLTAKGSIIRPQMYKIFETAINQAYDRLEEGQEGSLTLDRPSLEAYLMKLGQLIIGPQLLDRQTDFFSAGMDSLQAIQMRGHIVKDLNLGGNSKKLTQNVIFDTANVSNLAKHLLRIRQSQDANDDVGDPVAEMETMIQKYSNFERHIPRSSTEPDYHVVVLTGVTGALGAHILSQLLSHPSISKVYCLVRGKDPLSRIQNSLQSRGLLFSEDPTRLSALTSDLSHPRLGLDERTYTTLATQTTHIMHCAWPVNFQLSLSSFDPHVSGLHNLLELSLSVPHPASARLLFCSSVSAAMGALAPALIPEAPITDLAHAADIGYGRSKLVGEHVVQAAVENAGARATVLRIGQVVGDTKRGRWNENEQIPLIVRSALTMGCLPELDMSCEWLPVDVLATAILELAGMSPSVLPNTMGNKKPNGTPAVPKKKPNQLIYNILSPHSFPWTHSLLPALSRAGLSFTPVPTSTWLHQLRSLSQSDSKNGNPAADPERNPALKLVGHFEKMFGNEGTGEGKGKVGFEIGRAVEDSRALRGSTSVLESGLVGKMMAWWMGRWGYGKVGEEE